MKHLKRKDMTENPTPIRIDEAASRRISVEAREIARKTMERRAKAKAKKREREKNVVYPEFRKPDVFEALADEIYPEEERLYQRAYNKLIREEIQKQKDRRLTDPSGKAGPPTGVGGLRPKDDPPF